MDAYTVHLARKDWRNQMLSTGEIMGLTKSDYRAYIISPLWRDKHKDFLKRSHYRCAFFPFIKCGKKARYNVHHMNYENLGSEKLWSDVIVVCPFVHNFIIHGLLSGFRRPSQQKNYPNAAQRLAHFWCCQPVMIRGALALAIGVNLVLGAVR